MKQPPLTSRHLPPPPHHPHRDEATLAATAFYLREEKDDNKVILEDKDLEIIGTALIKYGDSTVIVQHIETGLWLSYRVCGRMMWWARTGWVRCGTKEGGRRESGVVSPVGPFHRPSIGLS